MSLSLPTPSGNGCHWLHAPTSGGSPEQCEGALGAPEAKSRSSNPQQPSKQGNSPSNPIGATHHPSCQSRCDLGNFPDTVLASKKQEQREGSGAQQEQLCPGASCTCRISAVAARRPPGKCWTGSSPGGKWEGRNDNAKNLVQN